MMAALVLAAIAACQRTAERTAGVHLSQYVDPFIGTSGMGHTFPGACVPFGGVQSNQCSR